MARTGRPKTDTEAVMVRMPRDLLDRLDEKRRQVEDIPSRPEMIRRLLDEQLPKIKESE